VTVGENVLLIHSGPIEAIAADCDDVENVGEFYVDAARVQGAQAAGEPQWFA